MKLRGFVPTKTKQCEVERYIFVVQLSMVGRTVSFWGGSDHSERQHARRRARRGSRIGMPRLRAGRSAAPSVLVPSLVQRAAATAGESACCVAPAARLRASALAAIRGGLKRALRHRGRAYMCACMQARRGF